MTACRIYRGPTNGNGYGRVPFGSVRLDEQGRRRGRHSVGLHRWVVEQVEGRPLEPGEVVMHTCDTPACFLYEHLRRGTQADNVHDAEVKGRGRRAHGIAHPLAKLADEQARAIHASTGPARVVAAEYGVSATLVRKVRAGQAWAHATCPNAGDWKAKRP